MKGAWTKGLFMGALVGASAAIATGMMNRQMQKRVVKLVCGSSQKLADKAESLFR